MQKPSYIKQSKTTAHLTTIEDEESCLGDSEDKNDPRDGQSLMRDIINLREQSRSKSRGDGGNAEYDLSVMDAI